jgi:hypothetical protein
MSSSTAEQLPQELWALILQHVDDRQRLSACALVCRKLARAAAAATQSLRVSTVDRPQRHTNVLAWAGSHGSSLTSMCLFSDLYNSPIRQLPCPNLRELNLSECRVQLCASSEHSGLLHSCTALTKLVLRYPTLLAGGVPAPAGVVPSAVARLHSLTLYARPSQAALDLPGEPEAARATVQMLAPHLTSLTHLYLFGDRESPSCFKPHISTLVRLQQLSLRWIGERTATAQVHACLLRCKLACICINAYGCGGCVTLTTAVANSCGCCGQHLL